MNADVNNQLTTQFDRLYQNTASPMCIALLNNGNMRVYASENTSDTLLFETNTSDRTVNDAVAISSGAFVWVTLDDSQFTVTPNGRYLLLQPDSSESTLTVQVNAINSSAMLSNCQVVPERFASCVVSMKAQYCPCRCSIYPSDQKK